MPEGYSVAEAKAAIEALGTKVVEFKNLVAQRDKEIKELGEASANTKEQLAKCEKALDKAEDMKTRLDQLETAFNRRKARHESEEGPYRKELTDAQMEYKSKLLHYMRKGEGDGDALHAIEQKALSVQSDPDGGYFVTPDMNGRIVERIFETSPVRSVAAVQTISTDALTGPIDDDEAGYEWVGETAAPTDATTPQVGQWRIPVHELSTEPRATQKLLEDAAVNVETWLSGKVADRFARAENYAFVLGDGISKPRGFLTYPAAADNDVYERGAVGRITSATNSVISFDDMIEVFYKLKGAYRNAATWVMNRRTFSVIRKLKDLEGQYLWEASLQVGQPSAILGRPILEMNDMPDVADGTLPVALADWSRAYQIVDRTGISVLRDPYTAKPFVKFYTRKRVGGDVLNFDAIKLLLVQ